jgi:hypothetical protein
MKITVETTATQDAALLNDTLDIDAWVQGAVRGKIANCTKRMQQEWTQKLMADPNFTDPIPSNIDDFIALVLARMDYKTRAQRDAVEGV